MVFDLSGSIFQLTHLSVPLCFHTHRTLDFSDPVSSPSEEIRACLPQGAVVKYSGV